VKTTRLPKTIGSLIRRLRLQAELSHEQLSKRCRIHRSYFSIIENGEAEISSTKLVRICNALAIKPSRFFEILEAEDESGELVIPDPPRLKPYFRRKKTTRKKAPTEAGTSAEKKVTS
jgi:transcriptional regulator with XRE-family HTH domain